MGVNGKAKGGIFEREIAKKLTLWASGQMDKLWYWRTPSSGGMGKNYYNVGGDIVALVPEAEPLTNLFSIEIKHHKDIDILDHWNKTSKIGAFWTQCCGDAQRSNKWPMLIMKKTRVLTVIGFGDNIELQVPHYINIMYDDKENLKLYYAEDFFSMVTFEDIIALNRENQ